MGEIRRVLVIGAGPTSACALETLCDDTDNEVVGAVSRDGSGLPAPGPW